MLEIIVLIVVLLAIGIGVFLWLHKSDPMNRSSAAVVGPVAPVVPALPKLVVILRHCDKPDTLCTAKLHWPDCCLTEHTAPWSCDDCSQRGYQRADGLAASMQSLLNRIAGGAPLTAIYAAGSKETNAACGHSRRMREMVAPMAAELGMSVNASYCVDQQQQVAQNILATQAGGIVAVCWEHEHLPAVAGWLIALAINPAATAPVDMPSWPGKDVYDQFWLINFTSGKPVFTREPELILPGDCPYAQLNNACVAAVGPPH